ncbi:MAG: hypothetical protein ABIB47_00735 [Candidatus Woesearchaeota archaeon]
MPLESSDYWNRKRKFRPELTDNLIELCIQKSDIFKDRTWPDVYNAIARIPPAGRILKVAYKRKGKTIKIVTAYWLD